MISGRDLKNPGRFVLKPKISRDAGKIGGKREEREVDYQLKVSEIYENAWENNEITQEDFNSIFLWKVFWKLIKAETPLIFCLKVLLAGVVFTVLLLFFILLGELVGE